MINPRIEAISHMARLDALVIRPVVQGEPISTDTLVIANGLKAIAWALIAAADANRPVSVDPDDNT